MASRMTHRNSQQSHNFGMIRKCHGGGYGSSLSQSLPRRHDTLVQFSQYDFNYMLALPEQGLFRINGMPTCQPCSVHNTRSRRRRAVDACETMSFDQWLLITPHEYFFPACKLMVFRFFFFFGLPLHSCPLFMIMIAPKLKLDPQTIVSPHLYGFSNPPLRARMVEFNTPYPSPP